MWKVINSCLYFVKVQTVLCFACPWRSLPLLKFWFLWLLWEMLWHEKKLWFWWIFHFSFFPSFLWWEQLFFALFYIASRSELSNHSLIILITCCKCLQHDHYLFTWRSSGLNTTFSSAVFLNITMNDFTWFTDILFLDSNVIQAHAL